MPNTITSYYDFTPGTLMRSAQVDNNFSNHRGNLIPIDENTATSSDLSHDLGSSEHRWKDIYGKSMYDTVVKTTAYSVTSSDQYLFGDASSGAIALTLPTATGDDGRWFNFKKIDSSANTLSIVAVNSELIDGTTTVSISEQYGSKKIVAENNAWQVVSQVTESGVSGNTVKVAYVKEIQAVNTNGGTFTNGAYRTRTLNTVQGDTSIVSLSSNQFTLAAGEYQIEAFAPAYYVSFHKALLYNATDATNDIIGSTMISPQTASAHTTNSVITGKISIAASKAFEIRHACSLTNAGTGFGPAANLVVSEVYTQVKITKIS